MLSTVRSAILRDEMLNLADALNKTTTTMVKLAAKYKATVVPNYTNGVAAQPNSYGHYLLGMASGLERDAQRLREAYADRIVARLGRHIQNLERATIARVALSPADVAATNVNLVGGDIYGGSCALDQNFLFRPLPQAPGHRTPVDGLWHVGASTHPGPGLGAGSGYLVYKELTKPPLRRRLLARVPGRS